VNVDAHIFDKELRAALYGLSLTPEGEKALLVVDNAAVARARGTAPPTATTAP
jgi:hypothetical protein